MKEKIWVNITTLENCKNICFYENDKVFYYTNNIIYGYNLIDKKIFYEFNLNDDINLFIRFFLTKNKLIINYYDKDDKLILGIYELHSQKNLFKIFEYHYLFNSFDYDLVILDNNKYINSNNEIDNYEIEDNIKYFNFKNSIVINNYLFDISNKSFTSNKNNYYYKNKNQIFKKKTNKNQFYLIDITSVKREKYLINIFDSELKLGEIFFNENNDQLIFYDNKNIYKLKKNLKIREIMINNSTFKNHNEHYDIYNKYFYSEDDFFIIKLSKDNKFFISENLNNGHPIYKIYNYQKRKDDKFREFASKAMIEFIHSGNKLIEIEDMNGNKQKYNKDLLTIFFPLIKNNQDIFYLKDYTINQLNKLIKQIATDSKITEKDLYSYLN